MKILVKNIGLTLLALFCLSSFSFSQESKDNVSLRWGRADEGTNVGVKLALDTTKLIKKEKHYDANTKLNYWFAEVDTNRIGVLGEDLKWLIEPKFCAIADYDVERGLVSARACPFEYNVNQMKYWYNEPTYGNWGIADTNGNWIIESHYEVPLKLKTKWQMAFSNNWGGWVPIIGLEEMWKGEFDNIVPFGQDAFIISKGERIGLRTHAGDWLVELSTLKIINSGQKLLLIDSTEWHNGSSFNIKTIDRNYKVGEIKGFDSCMSLFGSVSVYEVISGVPIQQIEESIGNAKYLNNDSSFGAWFVLNYWNNLFGSKSEQLQNENIDYYNYEVFADTIYSEIPDDWYPYERVSESEHWFDIEKSDKCTYSVLKHEYHITYGSRGPAYEKMVYTMQNVQITNGKTYVLELADCFKKQDLEPLIAYLNMAMADSFNIYWERIKYNEALWKLTDDSLVFYFLRFSEPMAYSEFNFNYRRFAIKKKELGRTFLTEKRRAKQLLKQ